MKQPTHGGARKGSGRKPGVRKAPPTATSSLRMRTATWAKLDAMRGNVSRSRWIAGMIEGAGMEWMATPAQPGEPSHEWCYARRDG
jgi:hypothetical protein